MKTLVLSFLLAICSGSLFATETTIKGGRMELINKGDSVLFTKGVRLNRGTDQIDARQMKTNRDRDKIEVKGDVKLFRRVSSTETWQGFGESGYYDTQEGSGYLLGSKKEQAKVIHTEMISSTSSRVVTLIADRIDFLRDTNKAYAKGSVQGTTVDPETGEQYDFWSDNADFDGEEKTVTLYGEAQPLVVQTTSDGRRTLRGDHIVYFTEEQRMTSEGHSYAVFEDKKDTNKK